jgi:hypothetical protein
MLRPEVWRADHDVVTSRSRSARLGIRAARRHLDCAVADPGDDPVVLDPVVPDPAVVEPDVPADVVVVLVVVVLVAADPGVVGPAVVGPGIVGAADEDGSVVVPPLGPIRASGTDNAMADGPACTLRQPSWVLLFESTPIP